MILPDIGTCADCLREILYRRIDDFVIRLTNCTNCGPRFSIIEALPYDRAKTSMKKFVMCGNCEREYRDPANRRFHAQPNACPVCGPDLELRDGAGRRAAQGDDALLAAAAVIREEKASGGRCQGLGGFQLIVDARSEAAVVKLRARKHREEKPLALMYPSLEAARADCHISDLEMRLLVSPESPIVLLKRLPPTDNQASAIASLIAPGNPNLGVMLPYTPLHHLLMRELNFPIVATSGDNISHEPICIDEADALKRLRGLADFLSCTIGQ